MAGVNVLPCVNTSWKDFWTNHFRLLMVRTDVDDASFLPLIFTSCSGDGDDCFTDASINYVEDMSRSVPVELWFKDAYLKLADILVGEKEITKQELPIIENLIDAVNKIQQHLPCLRSLLNDEKETSEAMVMVVLALHYFKPLAYNSSCIVNSKSADIDECPYCKENVKPWYADTSFGNSNVWHGDTDIVLQRSVIKIKCESGISNIQLDDDEGSEADEDNALFTEVKTEEKKQEKKAILQAIAQTIVNAFYGVNRDKTLHKEFIPSFLASQRHIQIIMYNCDSDQLLMSEKCAIWEKGENLLNISTLVKVWFALNYSHKVTDNISDDMYLLKNTPACNFKHLVGDSYSIYETKIQRPLRQEKEEPKSNTRTAECFIFARRNILELYNKALNN